MSESDGFCRVRKTPGKGIMHHGCKRIVVSFDVETFEQIRTRAIAKKTSFSEQVRLLTEWGLEAEDHPNG